jgi:hypothetical protein
MNKMSWRKIGPLLCLGFFMSSAPALAGDLEDQLGDAIGRERPDEVQAAINRGADVNAVNDHGESLLYYADDVQEICRIVDDTECVQRLDEIIRMLEAAGARDE